MYHPHGMTLSSGQIKKLARGEKVRLKHSQLTGPHQVHLLKSQMNKVAKHHALKKGMDLQFSAKQARHNLKHGSGWKETLLSGLKTGAKFLAPIAGELIRKEVVPRATDLMASLADKGLKRVGMGAKKTATRRRKTAMHGAGFWSDVWDATKSVGKTVGEPLLKDVVVPLATQAVKKRVGLGAKRKAKGKGVLSDVFSSIGLGAKKPRTRKRMVKGKGWGDFVGAMKSVGDFVSPVVKPLAKDVLLPIAIGAISKKLGGAVKRKVHRRGKGLFPPGY